ncbi:MAG: phospho-N-acetylmuramoyl-pentapeptide-transferase [Clostridia bacterium]|nr:phospho-N-acetylmuramoyl-pentapeptide-transferase [Clostridia bacterium]
MNELAPIFIAALVLTFALTAVITRIIIPILKSKKMGQKILDIGPRWHKNKEGTPMMGGLAFIISTVIVGAAAAAYCVIAGKAEGIERMLLTLFLALMMACIGFIDDRAKLLKKQNEGLSAKQKFLLQLIAAGIYLAAMTLTGNMTTVLYIPYLGIKWELSWFYYVFALILICGMDNSVNLTDGIDGLASTVTAVVGAFFALASVLAGDLMGTVLSAMLIGGVLGFLVYNFYPAKIFMGDTGSLFLGGMVVGLAFMLNNPLIVVICGLVYICETLSSMIQVIYFKLTHGKRFFKMAPIHHHFEKCGWSEVKIVAVFSLVTLVLCACAIPGLR